MTKEQLVSIARLLLKQNEEKGKRNVESCKLACIPVKDYFVKFFESIASVRTDCENLLPTTIGLKQ